MAAGSTDVVVKFLADVSDIARGVDGIGKTTNKLERWAKRATGLIAGVFSFRLLTDFIASAEEADSVSRGLAKALGNAGDKTGGWAKRAEDLADTLQRKTGIDDEVIKKGATILATFQDLSGETGQQTGAFDRATKAALDLSKAGFGDVDSSAKALGKALQDPEKGLAALRKAGVNFTPAQQDQIKGFIQAGDKAGAMNVILGEVEKQVGGVAEATVTSSDKMRVSWDETKESIGRALLPALQTLAPILETIAHFVQENVTWILPLTAAVLGVAAAIWIWNAAMAANPIMLIVIAIAALVAAVILLWQHWDQVWAWIMDHKAYALIIAWIFPIVAAIVLLVGIVKFLWENWDTIWGWISDKVSWVWDNILKPAFESTKILFGQMGDAIKWVWDNVIKPAWDAMSAAWSWMWDHVLKPGFEATKTMWSEIGDAISWVWNNVIKPVWDKIRDAAQWIGDKIDWLIDKANTAKGIIEKIPGVGLIPGMAAGGIVTRPTLAMIGEAGPEAVIPLSRGAPRGIGAGTVININITTTGLGADAPAIQSAVVAALRNYSTRNGPLPRAVTGV